MSLASLPLVLDSLLFNKSIIYSTGIVFYVITTPNSSLSSSAFPVCWLQSLVIAHNTKHSEGTQNEGEWLIILVDLAQSENPCWRHYFPIYGACVHAVGMSLN